MHDFNDFVTFPFIFGSCSLTYKTVKHGFTWIQLTMTCVASHHYANDVTYVADVCPSVHNKSHTVILASL